MSVPFLRFQTAIFGLAALALANAGAPAQTTPGALQRALESLASEGLDAQTVRATRKIRNHLADYFETNKSKRWDTEAPPAELDSARKLANATAQLDTMETIDAFVRHAAEFLLRYPDHAEFSERLWRLAAVVELIERDGNIGVVEGSLLPALLKGCAMLPIENTFFLEGQLLSARSKRERGDFKEEEAIYRSLLERRELDDAVLFSTRLLLALSFEQQQRFGDALAEYEHAREHLAVFPQASDAVLRAAFIHLEKGRPAKARELLTELSRRATPALRDLAASAADIKYLLQLQSKDDDLDHYWKRADLWWKKWLALRGELGVDRPENNVQIALSSDMEPGSQLLAAGIATGDAEAFFGQLDTMLHSLRWSPASIADLGAAVCFLAPRFDAGQQESLYEFMLEICAGYAPADRGLRRVAQMYQTVCYSDTGKTEQALEVIKAFLADDPEPDETSETILRLWAHLAVSDETDAEPPRQALEQLLDSGKPLDNRAQTVLYLGQLLRKLGAKDDERTLLERELGNREVMADKRIATSLEQRVRELSQDGAPSEAFSKAVAEWIEEYAPGWLAFSLPGGLKSPLLKGIDVAELIADPRLVRLSTEDRVQLELLAASTADLPLAVKEQAFRSAFAGLYGEAGTHSAARQMLRAVLRDDRFPKALQQVLLIFSLDEALSRGRKRDLTNVLTHPLLDRDNPRLMSATQVYGRFAAVDLTSVESLMTCYEDLATDGVAGSELAVIAQLFENLLALGALDQAQQIHDGVRDWNLAPDAGQNKTALRLAFLKALKRARASVPFAGKMRKLADQHIPEKDTTEAPSSASDLKPEFDLKRLSEAEGYRWLLHQLYHSPRLQDDARFWFNLAEHMPRDEAQLAFSFGLLENLLTSDVPDLEKSFSLLSAPSVVDTDDPEILDRLLRLFDEHVDSDATPMTYAATRIVEIQSRDLRQGKPTDLEAEWKGLVHPALSSILPPSKLRHLMAQRNIAGLQAALETLPANQLFSTELLDSSWPALAMAGMTDEADLAQEAALENLPIYVNSAARNLDFGSINMAYDIATELGKPELLPKGWFEYLDGAIVAERDRYSLRIREGQLREDWKMVAKWAGQAIKEYPSYYNYYRPHGQAMEKLGKKKAAIKSLEIYTKYSKDEVEWRDAMDLLEQLRKTAAAPSE